MNEAVMTTTSVLDKLDLNLLRVLDVLMQERKVASAAQRLGLSQPAVSNALARLRSALGDELLTRSSSGMQPTAYALSIHASLEPALRSVQAALRAKTAFNPSQDAWHARLVMTDIGEIVFLPPLLAHLQSAAPNLQLSTVRNTTIDLPQAMADGKVDLALGWLPDLPQGFYQRHLFRQRYVVLMREGHPLAGGKFSLSKFVGAQHVVVQAQGTGHARANAALDKQGVSRRVALEVPHFLSVPYLLAQSDLIATVPERLAQAAASAFGLRSVAHPVDLPAFEVNLFWHRRAHQNSANRWLRQWLADQFAA
jgi:DNA-binding transcriptional LysR family regulator